MGNKSKPEITKCKASENWTRVTFKPDLAKFKMNELEKDVVALMKKRVVDMAGTLGKTVKVELNGVKVPAKCFLEYVNLYIDSANKEGMELPRFGIVLINLGLSMKSFYRTICANPKFVCLSAFTRR